MKNPLFAFLISVLTISSIFIGNLSIADQIPEVKIEWNPAELFILEKVTYGVEADLSERFKDSKDCIVRYPFLLGLLNGKLSKPPENSGIKIKNAIFNDALNFVFSNLPYLTSFNSCTFNNVVNFTHCKFQDKFAINDSHFYKDSLFVEIEANDTVFFRNSTFEQKMSLANAKINGNLQLEKSIFKNDRCVFDLNNIQVSGFINLDITEFHRTLILTGAQIGKQLFLREANFLSKKNDVIFIMIKVNENVFLSKTKFNGSVIFEGAEIGSNFVANETHFLNNEKLVSFNRMTVNGIANFKQSNFKGSVDFRGMEIKNSLNFDNSKFCNDNVVLHFDGLKVGRLTSFNDCEFECGVRFVGMDIGDQLRFINTKFNNIEKEANFNGTKVGDVFSIENATFCSSVNFQAVNVEGEFCAKNASFSNENAEVIFYKMKIGDAIFHCTIFRNAPSFKFMEAQNIEFYDTTFSKPIVDFSYLHCVTLAFCFKHEDESNNFYILNGIEFKSINAGDKAGSCEQISEILSKSKFNPGVYKSIEEYFKIEGYENLADKIFIDCRFREWNDRLHFNNSFKWWTNWIILLVLFGRSPELVILYSLFFVMIGRCIFHRKKMIILDNNNKNKFKYSSFWYSLDCFLPYINLYTANFWTPNPKYKWICRYMRFHAFIGWILIPIGLLAWSGIIQ
jgi:hypothetical protein